MQNRFQANKSRFAIGAEFGPCRDVKKVRTVVVTSEGRRIIEGDLRWLEARLESGGFDRIDEGVSQHSKLRVQGVIRNGLRLRCRVGRPSFNSARVRTEGARQDRTGERVCRQGG